MKPIETVPIGVLVWVSVFVDRESGDETHWNIGDIACPNLLSLLTGSRVMKPIETNYTLA